MANLPKPDPQAALKYFQQKLDFTAGAFEVKQWMGEKAPMTLIDVRRAEDFEKGHIPGAINLPKGIWNQPKGLAQDKTNVVYCYSQTCHLAAAASVEFAKQGYPVVEMEGGFENWRRSHFEVTSAVAVR